MKRFNTESIYKLGDQIVIIRLKSYFYNIFGLSLDFFIVKNMPLLKKGLKIQL